MSDLKILHTASGQQVVDYEYAKNIIEQQQARIAELRNQLKDMHYGAIEAGKMVVAYSRERDELVATVERLREAWQSQGGCGGHLCCIKKPEGIGHNGGCNCYRDQSKMHMLTQHMNAVLHQTPQQNLSAVKREAFIEGFIKGYESDVSVDPKELAIDSVDLCYPDKEQSDE